MLTIRSSFTMKTQLGHVCSCVFIVKLYLRRGIWRSLHGMGKGAVSPGECHLRWRRTTAVSSLPSSRVIPHGPKGAACSATIQRSSRLRTTTRCARGISPSKGAFPDTDYQQITPTQMPDQQPICALPLCLHSGSRSARLQRPTVQPNAQRVLHVGHTESPSTRRN